MMWDRLLAALVAAVVNDERIHELYADRVRLAGTGKRIETGEEGQPKRIEPILEYMLIGDAPPSELWQPHTVQFDQFCNSIDELATSEQALAALFQQDLPVRYSGVDFWTEYAGGDTLATPSRDGYYGRAIRFRCTPLRRKYATT